MAVDVTEESQPTTAELLNELAWRDVQLEVMQESIIELEREMIGWTQLGDGDSWTFSRGYLDRIMRFARLSYLRNPLLRHAVEVSAHYTIGQGITWKAAEPVRDVIDAFWRDPANRTELTSARGQLNLERSRCNDGNLFLALFTDSMTGRVQVRSLPVHEVREIIADPEDWRTVWLYKRCWEQTTFDLTTGRTSAKEMTAYYPDWRYQPKERPDTIGGTPVHWDAPVYHVSTGGLPHQLWGLPETYAALDWARAVTRDLEDYATVKRALAKFAFKMTGLGSKGAVQQAKAMLGTNAAPGVINTNPPPIPGSTFIARDGIDMQPIKTAGSQPSPDEGHRLWLMVAAGVGLPDTILSGNADVGNLATAKTLDRPTELKMAAQQAFWEEVFRDILDYVIDQAITALRGPLRSLGTVTTGPDGQQVITMRTDPATGEPYDRHLDLDFPNILDRDINSRINAIVTAATLAGNPPAGTLTKEQLSTLLMTELGVDDIEDELADLYPDDSGTSQPNTTSDEALIETLRELRTAVVAMHEREG